MTMDPLSCITRRWGTRALAEQRALQECHAAGGRECLAATWFENQCGASAAACWRAGVRAERAAARARALGRLTD
ncbi:MAG: DUF4189 domain-containing protein [Rubrivivax sp.]|nr:DUF4189 domain-containing protein [Rubrivivax sp.]